MKKPKWWRRIKNEARAFESRRKGWASYIDVDGRVRFARRINAGEVVELPMEHVMRIRHNG